MKNRFAKFVAVTVLAGFTLCGATAHAATNEIGGAAKAATKAAASSAAASGATSTAVYVASTAGMTAKTGTAIAALSGAAATKATLCAIGTPVVSALGLTVAPAVVGGAIVAGAGAAVGWGICKIIDWIW